VVVLLAGPPVATTVHELPLRSPSSVSKT